MTPKCRMIADNEIPINTPKSKEKRETSPSGRKETQRSNVKNKGIYYESWKVGFRRVRCYKASETALLEDGEKSTDSECQDAT